MGYERHHAICVTSWNAELLTAAREYAVRLFEAPFGTGYDGTQVSPVLASAANGTVSFFVAPDGSKEGWDASDEGDRRRAELVAYLRTQAYKDGSTPLAWCEVQYGDDDNRARIVRGSDRDEARALRRTQVA